jgi:cytochrome c biogenesis protein CcmG/thiol:disulfide interchange protein DsbE
MPSAGWIASLTFIPTLTGADLDDRVGGEWMVRGIPETFVVDRQGRIAYAHLGALNETAIEQTIVPLIAETRSADR